MVSGRVFLDSSVLVAAVLSSRGGSFYILNHLKNQYLFQTNDYCFTEVTRALDHKFLSRPQLKQNLFLLLGIASVRIIPNPSHRAERRIAKIINREDAPVLASALTHSAYLLTLDKDFLTPEVRTFAREQQLHILTPGEFIQHAQGNA